MKGICHIVCISAPYGEIMLFLLIVALPADISAPIFLPFGIGRILTNQIQIGL
jgi:hypothetical protein